MPLKILLADDSMTAQKMGKEILTSAGYEVIAVSNGAAAAKKLAEKPDLCILDIIMPGYTGIEVCEKVRASIETAKMPVLLTVGKMEHYDQKDVQRVSADGVIVKPFEASDLLASVQKLAEKLSVPPKAAAAAATPDYEKTMIFTPPNVEGSDYESGSAAESHDDATGEVPVAKKSMELPAEAAGIPAFLAADVAESMMASPEIADASSDNVVVAKPPSFPAVSSGTAAAAAPAREMDVAPVAPLEAVAPAVPGFDFAPAAPAFDLTPVAPIEEPPAVQTPQLTHVESQHVESLLASSSSVPAASVAPVEEHALEFTAQPSVEVTVPMISGFEATAHESVEVGQEQDPALVTGTEGFDSFTTKIGHASRVAEPAATEEQDDFEARVAAAMSELEEPVNTSLESCGQVEAAPVEVVPERVEAAPVEVGAAAESTLDPRYETTQKISVPAEFLTESAAPVETEGAVEPAISDSRAVSEAEQMQGETSTAAEQEFHCVPEIEASPAPSSEPSHQDLELAKAVAQAVGAEAPPPSTPSEAHQIAQTVHNVLERMLPNIMEEVKKELESWKK